jgi:uncharacterized cupin superfamily protein
MTVPGYIVEAGEGRPFGAGRIKLATGEADFSVFESATPPNPDGVPAHIHDVFDEAFYVLEGEMEYVVGAMSQRCGPGAFVFVPRGTSHRFANHGPATARVLVIGSSGVQALVEEVAPLMAANPPDTEAVVRAFARHQSRLDLPH